VAICARNDDELQRAQSDLRRISKNVRVLRIACDLTQQEEAENLVRRVHQEFGHIDVLVNNAGTIQVAPLEEMDISDFEEAMKTNFWAAIYVTLAALPNMRRRGIGRIVNISSIGGLLSVPHLLPYCCSKFALTGFSEGLHTEVARDGIVVTTVCPGLMRTGSARNAYFKGKHRAEYTWFRISDALPFTSMNAERAARQIVKACQQGRARVVLTIQAELAVLLHCLFPATTAQLFAFVNRLLPSPGGIGKDRRTGAESASKLSQSFLTTLEQRAARLNNQLA